jgi:CTP:molybdopterin cytidylyltransferase MocA
MFTAIVLAAQRAGRIDSLAAAAAVSHKCVVPVAGAALIRHVVAALGQAPGLDEIRISVEPEAVPMIRQALAGLPATVVYVPSADNLADSVYAAARDACDTLLITTADNVLLTAAAVTEMIDTLDRGADGAIALASRAAVLAAHPEGQRRFYRFADDSYSNCNLYALRGPKTLALVESFRTGGQFARNPMRLVVAFGIFNLILLRLHRLSLAGAARRLSRRFGIRMAQVVLADGAHAIDVDNQRTLAVTGELLAARSEAAKKAA